MTSVTEYGSQLLEGLLSSRYPYPFSATSLGILMLLPLLATPALKSWMLEVSWSPVSLLSLSFPSLGSYAMMCLLWCLERLSIAASMAFIPPGRVSGEVTVSSGSIPVSGHWLGIEGHHHSEVLRHSAEEISGDPEIVPHVDTFGWPDLVLPLCRHDLGVGARDSDPGVETCAVVSLHNVPAVDLVSPHPAVVGTLWPGEPVLGPAEWVLVLVQQSVLLLDTEPWVVVLGLLHHLLAGLPLVGVSWQLVVLVRLAQHQDVVAPPEGVRVDLDGVQVGVGVGAL